MEATRKRSRYGMRDALMILAADRHVLRAVEVTSLDFAHGLLHVRRSSFWWRRYVFFRRDFEGD
jgi:hypothetical protein